MLIYEFPTNIFFFNACNELYVHIGFLFSSLVMHAYAPSDLLISAVIPLPKRKNSNAIDSANYHGISLSSIFGKLFLSFKFYHVMVIFLAFQISKLALNLNVQLICVL